MSEEQSVVIVGAGPCGLAAACELRKLGMPVRILDAAADRVTGSRAIMLWPPALEVLDAIGLLEQARERALQLKAYVLHLGSATPVPIQFRPELAPLILPQDVTSGLLENELTRMGCEVERSVEVTEIKPGTDSVTVRARRGDGSELTIEADWLIGADGVHSTVRKRLDIDFAGMQYPSVVLLAEARLDGDLDRYGVHITVRQAGGGLLIAPLPDGNVRIATVIEDGTPVTAETVQRMLDERGPGGGLRVAGEPAMLTTFMNHERVAGSMRVGRCFLVGDAAHMNSVIGGQGLSVGFQDVHNLAWKLAGVAGGRLSPAVLDSYDPERRAAAEQVIRLTGRMNRQTDLGPVATLGRNALLRVLGATGILERTYIPMLAGRQIRYPQVLGPEPGRGAGASARRRGRRPQPGTPAPGWVPRACQDSLGLFRLVTTGDEAGEVTAAVSRLAASRPELARHSHVRLPGRGSRSWDAFVLLRPDGFVARGGRAADVAPATEFLDALVPAPDVSG
jgi:2-polyprenyl-6-methoxyphenol hydroxylase-like FAD-dependent oxidoreductase